MGQDIKIIEETYDIVAEEYAEEFVGEHAKKPMDRTMLRRFARELGNRKPVWDFGCGPGQTSAFLKGLGVEISGMDLSQKILEHAARRHPGISFRQGNILATGFQKNSIAGIVAFYAIVHFTQEQVESAFQEIFRILQPGGTFLLTFHIGVETLAIAEYLGKSVGIDFMFFTTEFISGALGKAGFEKIDIIERDPYPEVEYESRRAYVLARKPEITCISIADRLK